MINKYTLPYGKTTINFDLPVNHRADIFLPIKPTYTCDETQNISTAIRNPLDCSGFPDSISSASKVVIVINDKTRPAPSNKMLPPLLAELIARGVGKENITIIIAVGTHQPLPEVEFPLLLCKEILQQYKVISHDCDYSDNLIYKGLTTLGTPIYINKIFDQADLKIVVGDIEFHYFAGYSGGVKSAAIGVCGRETITHNHSFLLDPKSCVARFEDNPVRQDIEEIGQIIGVDLALNAILDEDRHILHAFFGKPKIVLLAGIKKLTEIGMVQIDEPYDLVIASAGGYPKDINLYQSQKALTYASLFCKNGGKLLLAAACEEGVGSKECLDFFDDVHSYQEARAIFTKKGFMIGPHKVIQFANIADRIKFQIKSEIDPILMKKVLIDPIDDFQTAINDSLKLVDPPLRIAIIPYATAIIPQFSGVYYG